MKSPSTEPATKGEVFTIRPLKWKRGFTEYSQTYASDAAHGGYQVTRFREDCEDHENCQIESHGKWLSWKWEYCFCEYYNEASIECANAKEGKIAAENHWREYLKAGLELINSCTPAESK